MLHEKTIAVVVPAYNESRNILEVLETMPDFVDRIIVVNDRSTDDTAEIVLRFMAEHNPVRREATPPFKELAPLPRDDREVKKLTPIAYAKEDYASDRVILINHEANAGVGAAIATGYRFCRDHFLDCAAVMAGDGQMDPAELESICSPVAAEAVDYVKGNRLIHRSAWLVIPKVRFIGNSILSMLTKIASGYWHISDTQTGYTAISLRALQAIRIFNIYKQYGVPNDILVKLNIAFCTIREVEIRPIYKESAQSKMRISKVIPTISLLLALSFFKRLFIKYLFRDFHPLFLLFMFSFGLGALALVYAVKIAGIMLADGNVPTLTFLAFVFLFTGSFQSFVFAMWMDMLDNQRLYK